MIYSISARFGQILSVHEHEMIIGIKGYRWETIFYVNVWWDLTNMIIQQYNSTRGSGRDYNGGIHAQCATQMCGCVNI